MPRPQRLRIGIPKIYPAYDPSHMETTPQVFVLNLLMGLLIDVGDNNEFYPAIATHWKIEKEHKKFTFFISKTAKFSNGQPITTRDVEASLKRFVLLEGTHLGIKKRVQGGNSFRKMSDPLPALSRSDDSVTIELLESEPQFLHWIATQEMGILTVAQAHQPKFEVDFGHSSGAYFIESRTQERLVLRQNKNFYRSFGSAASCLEVLEVPTTAAAIDGLTQGTIDVLDYGAVLDPEFRRFTLPGTNISYTKGDPKAVVYLIPNPTRDLFKEASRRQELFHALDREQLIPYASGDIFRPTTQFLTPNHLGRLSKEEEVGVVGKKTSEGRNLFQEKIRVLYPEIFGDRYKKILHAELSRHFSSVEFVTYKEGEVATALKKNDCDAFFFIVGTAEKDAGILMSYHFQRGSVLYPGLDSEIPRLLDEAMLANDSQQRLQIYKSVSKRLLSTVTMIPIATFTWPIFYRSDLIFETNKNYRFSNNPWCLSWKHDEF